MRRWRSPAGSPMSAPSTGHSIAMPGNGASRVEETGISSDWLLRLDADYMVEPALRDELGPGHTRSGDGGLRDRLHLLHRRPAVAGLALSGAAGPVPSRPRALRAGWPHREAAHRRAGRSASTTACCTMIARAWSAGCSRNRAIRPRRRRSWRRGLVGAELAGSPQAHPRPRGRSPSRCIACSSRD